VELPSQCSFACPVVAAIAYRCYDSGTLVVSRTFVKHEGRGATHNGAVSAGCHLLQCAFPGLDMSRSQLGRIMFFGVLDHVVFICMDLMMEACVVSDYIGSIQEASSAYCATRSSS
jgi:hypothetical protein